MFNFFKNEKGSSSLEIILLLSIVMVLMIALYSFFGGKDGKFYTFMENVGDLNQKNVVEETKDNVDIIENNKIEETKKKDLVEDYYVE